MGSSLHQGPLFGIPSLKGAALSWVAKTLGSHVGQPFFKRVPPYNGYPKRDPNLENYPYG